MFCRSLFILQFKDSDYPFGIFNYTLISDVTTVLISRGRPKQNICVKHRIQNICVKHRIQNICVKHRIQNICVKHRIQNICVKHRIQNICVKHRICFTILLLTNAWPVNISVISWRSVLLVVFNIVVCPFVLFLLAIVLSVLRFMDSDYTFCIFKLFLFGNGGDHNT